MTLGSAGVHTILFARDGRLGNALATLGAEVHQASGRRQKQTQHGRHDSSQGHSHGWSEPEHYDCGHQSPGTAVAGRLVGAGGDSAWLFNRLKACSTTMCNRWRSNLGSGPPAVPLDLRWAVWSLRCGMTVPIPRLPSAGSADDPVRPPARAADTMHGPTAQG